MKMQAMVVSEPGPVENFELQEVEKPLLRQGHLLVKVHATSVNPVDTKVRARRQLVSPEYPAILHGDFAGIVMEVPSDVTRFKPGDRVYGLGGGIKGTIGGALAQYLLVDADLVAAMPTNLSFVEAASLPLVSITAWEALCDKMKVSRGDTLLVHGGVGGVGHIAAQLGKFLGAIVHTTVSSDADEEISKRLGADYVINYKKLLPEEYVQRFTKGKGFDCVFDTVGDDNLERSFEAARLSGSVASIVVRGMHDLTLMYSKGLTLHSVFMLIPLITGIGRGHYAEILTQIKQLVESGIIKPLVCKEVFNWKQVAQAHAMVEGRGHKGKVVLVVE